MTNVRQFVNELRLALEQKVPARTRAACEDAVLRLGVVAQSDDAPKTPVTPILAASFVDALDLPPAVRATFYACWVARLAPREIQARAKSIADAFSLLATQTSVVRDFARELFHENHLTTRTGVELAQFTSAKKIEITSEMGSVTNADPPGANTGHASVPEGCIRMKTDRGVTAEFQRQGEVWFCVESQDGTSLKKNIPVAELGAQTLDALLKRLWPADTNACAKREPVLSTLKAELLDEPTGGVFSDFVRSLRKVKRDKRRARLDELSRTKELLRSRLGKYSAKENTRP